jgi:hypothetical protein
MVGLSSSAGGAAGGGWEGARAAKAGMNTSGLAACSLGIRAASQHKSSSRIQLTRASSGGSPNRRDTINSGNRTTPHDHAGFVIVTTCDLQMEWHAENQSVAMQADVRGRGGVASDILMKLVTALEAARDIRGWQPGARSLCE